MNAEVTEIAEGELPPSERPSAEFIRAVASLLETDAEDILAEMGYVPTNAVVERSAAAA